MICQNELRAAENVVAAAMGHAHKASLSYGRYAGPVSPEIVAELLDAVAEVALNGKQISLR